MADSGVVGLMGRPTGYVGEVTSWLTGYVGGDQLADSGDGVVTSRPTGYVGVMTSQPTVGME